MRAVRSLTMALLAAAVFCSVSQAQLGMFDGHQDIGDAAKLGAEGSASYDAASGAYTVKGAGDDIWNKADAFHFAYKQWSGDFVFTSEVGIADGKADQVWIKAMLMARQDLTPGSAHVGTRIRRDGQFSMQWRLAANGDPAGTAADKRKVIPNPSVNRLERKGNTFIASYQAADGSWVVVDQLDVPMTDPILVGPAVTAHDTGYVATGTFKNVTIQGAQSEASAWDLYE